jgi:hypothetical protein
MSELYEDIRRSLGSDRERQLLDRYMCLMTYLRDISDETVIGSAIASTLNRLEKYDPEIMTWDTAREDLERHNVRVLQNALSSGKELGLALRSPFLVPRAFVPASMALFLSFVLLLVISWAIPPGWPPLVLTGCAAGILGEAWKMVGFGSGALIHIAEAPITYLLWLIGKVMLASAAFILLHGIALWADALASWLMDTFALIATSTSYYVLLDRPVRLMPANPASVGSVAATPFN